MNASYFWHNEATESARFGVVGSMFLAPLLAGVFGVLWLATAGRTAEGLRALQTFARLAMPVAALAVLPCFFDWKLWNGHPLVFLFLVLLDALAIGRTFSNAMAVDSAIGRSFGAGQTAAWARVRALMRSQVLPFATVLVLAVAYILWFSYFTVVNHRSVRSGYDLAIEDNILWNLLRGSFFHAAPTLGPTGTHFGRHATLISYLLLPFYALHQSAETLLVLQSVALGLAAIPLFLFARGRVGGWPATLVAVAYLLHPALQESNLFEVHYIKFGAVFFWTALWLLDSGRIVPALVAAFLTLLVREDVATWVVVLGLFAFLSGQKPRAGLVMTVAAAFYVVVVKFVVMPSFLGGNDDILVYLYQDLVPKGHNSFGWVLATALSNPAFTLETLLDSTKLKYFLEIFVPLACLPLRKGIGWLALIPGIVYCFLGGRYAPLVDIHYQYSQHILAFEFPALVLVLECLPSALASGGRMLSRPTALASLAAATLACSYQFGAVLQQHTSFGGPVPYKFGWDSEGRERRRAMDALLAVIPPNARVAASAFVVPQISARQNGYSLSLGLYDAEWIVAPTSPSEFVALELAHTWQALTTDTFGVVAVKGPFFAAKRGARSGLTVEILRRFSSSGPGFSGR